MANTTLRARKAQNEGGRDWLSPLCRPIWPDTISHYAEPDMKTGFVVRRFLIWMPAAIMLRA